MTTNIKILALTGLTFLAACKDAKKPTISKAHASDSVSNLRKGKSTDSAADHMLKTISVPNNSFSVLNILQDSTTQGVLVYYDFNTITRYTLSQSNEINFFLVDALDIKQKDVAKTELGKEFIGARTLFENLRKDQNIPDKDKTISIIDTTIDKKNGLITYRRHFPHLFKDNDYTITTVQDYRNMEINEKIYVFRNEKLVDSNKVNMKQLTETQHDRFLKDFTTYFVK